MMIIFITRKYPPSVGGMQKYSYELTSTLSSMSVAKIIAWGGSQIFLPWFYLKAFFQSAFWLLAKPVEIIHLGDALLSPLGWTIKKIFRKPAIATVHGLDLTFKFKPYQWIIPWFLRQLDRIICVSHYTQLEAVKRGVVREKTVVIPNGISALDRKLGDDESASRQLIERLVHHNLDSKKILLTVGRLVARKGIDYFISEVLPKIFTHMPDIVYIVIGEGNHREVIEKTISDLSQKDKVFLLGRVSDSVLQASYEVAHVFVMPNIPVEGDMEGFGLVALEASLAGLPVVASRLEGICDAIVQGKNGILIDYRDRDRFVEVILEFLVDEKKRREFGVQGRYFTLERYSWEKVGKEYLRVFGGCL